MALIKKIPIWLVLLEIPFLYLAIQYIVRDSLSVYDASSHYSQIWYLKEHLWPNFSGFNPHNLLGFDQGLLYPSLFHYVSATLGFVLSLDLATKVVVAITLLLLPLSCYLFSSILFFDNRARIFFTGMLLLVLAAVPGYLGANVKALFQVGLLPSFVSLPFVLLYVWSLFKRRQNWMLSTLLLSAVILTHLVAAIVCFVIFVSTVVAKYLNKKLDKTQLNQVLIAGGLTAFFTIPFVANYSLTSQSVHVASFFLPNVLVVSLILTTSFFIWKIQNEKLVPIALITLVLGSMVLVDAVILRFQTDSFFFEKIYNLHLYRYQIYFYIFAIGLVGYYPIRFLFEIPRRSLIKPQYLLFLPFLTLLFLTFVRQPFIVKTSEIKVRELDSSQRFIETFSREDAYPFIYSAQNKLIEDKGKSWAYGLLTDSTPNGPYIGSLIRSFDPFVSDENEGFVERRSLVPGRIYDTLDLLGIDSLLFLDPESVGKADSLHSVLLKSGVGNELIEIPKKQVKPSHGDWESAVELWWFEDGKMNDILVKDFEGKTTTSSATIKNRKNSPNWSKFSFEVDSEKPAPVLVKFTHLPGWKATVDGQETKIYTASPYLMLVNAHGRVEFEYHKQWYQWASIIVSVFTLILVVLLAARNFLGKNAKN